MVTGIGLVACVGALVPGKSATMGEALAAPWVVASVRPRVCVESLVLVQMATMGEALAAPWVVARKAFLLLDRPRHRVRRRRGWYFRHDASVSQELVAAIWRIRLEMPFVRQRSPHGGSERTTHTIFWKI